MDQNQDEPKSLLTKLRAHHVVAVHNPLTSDGHRLQGDFTWQLARSVTENDPAYRDQTIDSLRLRNDSHPTMKHVVQKITIPSGKTMRLPGDVAQIIVKHLVDEIMSRQGNKAVISDPVLRRQCEEMIIQNIDDLTSQLTSQNIEEQLEQQIRNLNQDEPLERTSQDDAETAFAGLNQGAKEAVAAGGSAKGGNPLAAGQKATAV